jgi:hypothetical protein
MYLLFRTFFFGISLLLLFVHMYLRFRTIFSTFFGQYCSEFVTLSNFLLLYVFYQFQNCFFLIWMRRKYSSSKTHKPYSKTYRAEASCVHIYLGIGCTYIGRWNDPWIQESRIFLRCKAIRVARFLRPNLPKCKTQLVPNLNKKSFLNNCYKYQKCATIQSL